MVVGELLMASVEQEHEPVSHYKRRSMESEEEQLQQPIAPKKTTSTSVDYREISPRSDSISTDSLNIMSYPENQQPASGATQTNGNGTANPSAQTSASPSSPAMERWFEERPWQEPFHAQGSRAGASNNANSGTSTQAEK